MRFAAITSPFPFESHNVEMVAGDARDRYVTYVLDRLLVGRSSARSLF